MDTLGLHQTLGDEMEGITLRNRVTGMEVRNPIDFLAEVKEESSDLKSPDIAKLRNARKK